jgi:NAD(P)-dependent dehydrogenase (short-subunit alcohol dehydrogenase family)
VGHRLITGAARGQGASHARRLAAEGAYVLACDILDAEGKDTADRLRQAGLEVDYLHLDVTSPDDWAQAVRHARAATGRLDVLVNNAALAGRHSKPLLGTEDSDFDAIVAVNLRGPFMLCRAAVGQMLTQDFRGDARGRIVNITSQHGMVGAPGHAAYAVSKAGLIQLTRQIAVEYGRDGIVCNGVAPGKVVTGTPGDLSQSETTAAYVRSRTPFARFGQPEDVAAAVGFLASDEATYISGATLMVDGGWMAY